MKKRILLIGYNYSPELTGIGKYSGEMMVWLAKQGYECTVLTSYPYYPYWNVQEPYKKNRYWFKTEHCSFESGGSIQVYRCPMFVPAKPTGLKRVMLDLTFMLSASFKYLQLLFSKKYDLVITIAPSFLYGLFGVLYKKLRGGTVQYHIHDMQIEAARDLQILRSEKFFDAIFGVEKFILDRVDVVSTVSEGMVQRIEKKANKPVYLFPNWTETDKFFPLENKATLKQEFGFKATDKVILYSGAIGEKQGLEAILYAAKELQDNPNLKFVICGSGPYKEKLQDLAETLQVPNVVFLPLQPHDKFNQFLNMADVHLVIQKANASDLMMPSKLTTILAVGGLALVTANSSSGLNKLMKKHNMGLVVDAENQVALNEGIKSAVTDDNSEKLANARLYAERYLSVNNIMKAFEMYVMHTVADKGSLISDNQTGTTPVKYMI